MHHRPATNHHRDRAAYSDLFGIEPYFVRPTEGSAAYLEYRIGDYQHEFGILSRQFAPAGSAVTGGAIAYWAVDSVDEAFRRLLAKGATVYAEPIERGPGFVTASVVDPFGNILGVMYNQHYLDVLGGSK